MIQRILQRGMDSGEFRPLDPTYAVYAVIAPMIFLILAKHSNGLCTQHGEPLDPRQFIAAQLATVLHGLQAATPQKNKP